LFISSINVQISFGLHRKQSLHSFLPTQSSSKSEGRALKERKNESKENVRERIDKTGLKAKSTPFLCRQRAQR
jgi:hypothetical protein